MDDERLSLNVSKNSEERFLERAALGNFRYDAAAWPSTSDMSNFEELSVINECRHAYLDHPIGDVVTKKNALNIIQLPMIMHNCSSRSTEGIPCRKHLEKHGITINIAVVEC